MSTPYCPDHLQEDNLRGFSSGPEDIEPLIYDDKYIGEHASMCPQWTKIFDFWFEKPYIKIWLIHVLAFILYTVVFLLFTESKIRPILAEQEKQLIYSPIREALQYENRVVNTTITHLNSFSGPPGPDIDSAWIRVRVIGHEVHLRLTETDMAQLRRSSIPLTDKPGTYLGAPDIYHQLHCVYTLYRAIHPEYYDGEANKEATITPVEHLDHCIQQLRQYLQCHVSSSVYTYRWEDEKALMTGNFDPENECVNWERFDEWVKGHAVDIKHPGLLIHPHLGPLYRG